MKLITWNVNSLRVRAELVALLLDEEQPDVLCLQELKLTDDKVPRGMFEERGYHLAVHGQPTYNGVLIASREPLQDIHRGLPEGDEGQARLVAARIGDLQLVNLYCPQGQTADSPKFAYKLRFFDALQAWVEARCEPDQPLILTGDLNIAPDPEDVWDLEHWQGVPTYHPEEHARWAKLCAWGLADLGRPHIPPGTFSFWDYRRASFRFDKGMRIDHFLGTKAVETRVTGAEVLRAWRKKRGELKASDHAPVALELGWH